MTLEEKWYNYCIGNCKQPLDYDYISYNQNITVEFIEKHIDKPWNWNNLSENPNITVNFLKKYIDKDWDWSSLSSNKNITLEFIVNNMYKQWCWSDLLKNKNITAGFIERNLNLYINREWDWCDVLSNPNIDEDFIDNNKRKIHFSGGQIYNEDNYYSALSYWPNISMKFIESHINEKWSWRTLSENPHISLEFIEKHIDKDWYWRDLSKNPKITTGFIETHIDKDWEWYELSRHRNVTMKFIEKYINLKVKKYKDDLEDAWEWGFISENPNITLDFIKKHSDKDWDWISIYFNKKLKNEFFIKNKNTVEIQTEMKKEYKSIETQTEIMPEANPETDKLTINNHQSIIKGNSLTIINYNQPELNLCDFLPKLTKDIEKDGRIIKDCSYTNIEKVHIVSSDFVKISKYYQGIKYISILDCQNYQSMPHYLQKDLTYLSIDGVVKINITQPDYN